MFGLTSVLKVILSDKKKKKNSSNHNYETVKNDLQYERKMHFVIIQVDIKSIFYIQKDEYIF